MTDEKKKDNKDGKEVKKVDDEQLKDVAGGAYSKTNSRGQTYYLHGKEVKAGSMDDIPPVA